MINSSLLKQNNWSGALFFIVNGLKIVTKYFFFYHCHIFSSVQSLSRVQLFVSPWTTACQASLSFTISHSLLKLMSTEWVMPSIRPRQMRSIFIQGEPELSLPAVLPAVLTALPLAPASSSLQCPPWGPDQGEEGQKGGNWAPLYFTSAT